MSQAHRIILILFANALLAVAIGIFAAGFFPYKAFIPGLAQWQRDSARVSSSPPFDKVVFMVVDALRSDFVYSNASNFHFTQSLIRDGAAMPFTGHASPPTITMPRVKAITTGSVPSFVDLVLNFAESDTTSTLATQDSWLAQLRAKQSGKLVMYGDDTWLRLFPGFFDRADGTTSFFVSDFTEVDNNVTRHIDAELGNDDWSAMTLHYLGLDHIGHKTGPRGPNMPAKQVEMDGIVQKIYEAMETKKHLASTVLVLLGDHGMNEGGNHGANSAGEVSTALTFISPKLKLVGMRNDCPITPHDDFAFYEMVGQSDIAPTLAALLDFPIPKNNLGVIIPQLLRLWPNSIDRYNLFYENAKQVWEIAGATFPAEFGRLIDQDECIGSTSDAAQLKCLWQRIENGRQRGGLTGDESERLLQSFLYKAQNILSGTASNYDTPKLMIGSVLALISFVLASVSLCRSPQPPSPLTTLIFTLLVTLYSLTMFASSYVEEEHQFWYWFSGFYLLILFFKASRFTADGSSTTSSSSQANVPYRTGTTTTNNSSSSFSSLSKAKHNSSPLLSMHHLPISPSARLTLVLLLTSIPKRLHQTGQKHAGSPHDLLTQLLLPHPHLLWTLIIATYTLYSRRLSYRASTRWFVGAGDQLSPSSSSSSSSSSSPATTMMGAIPVLVVMSTFVFKVAFTAADAPELVNGVVVLRPLLGLVRGYPLANLARLGFAGLAQMLACAIWFERPWQGRRELQAFLEALAEVLALALMMQTRTVYIVVFLMWELGVGMLGVGAGGEASRGEEEEKNKKNKKKKKSASGGESITGGVVGAWEVGVLSILMQWSSFFVMGGTNAISSVDLSNAYNGVKGYNVAVVGLLTFVSNWAGPIWWSIATMRLLVSRTGKDEKVRQVVFEHFVLLTTFVAASVASVMVACFVLKEHLFIWTVFSPKYLYTVAWTLAQHILVNGVLCTAVLSLSGS